MEVLDSQRNMTDVVTDFPPHTESLPRSDFSDPTFLYHTFPPSSCCGQQCEFLEKVDIHRRLLVVFLPPSPDSPSIRRTRAPSTDWSELVRWVVRWRVELEHKEVSGGSAILDRSGK